MANVTGWGRGTWGDGTWGEPIPFVVSGVNATGAITSVASVSGVANVTVSGVTGTGAITSVASVTIGATVTVSSVNASAAINGVAVGIGTDVYVSGVSATGSVGVVNVWVPITPSQPGQDWGAITTSQTPSWTGIAA
jgi:hypothetical protein